MKLVFEMPWPERKLGPNARINRFAKAALFKSAKAQACLICKSAMTKAEVASPNGVTRSNPVNIQLILTPPNLRYRDEDNLIANCKAMFDGIAEALGINDHFFHLREQVWNENEKPGKVVVVLDWLDAAESGQGGACADDQQVSER